MGSNYISVIKINNVSILPPLITPEKRKDLRRFKKQAIKIEKRLEHEKLISTKRDGCKNKIDKDIPTNGIDLSEYKKEYLKKLTCDIQAESYIDNEFVEINSHIDKWNSDNTRLIRSNSYILENPSPVLLEYIRKNNLTDQTFLHDNVEDDLSTMKINDDNFSIDQCMDTSCTETELNLLSDDSRPVTALTENSNPIKQFIDNNVPYINENVEQIDELEIPSDISDVLDKIPKEYSRRILEFLENRKVEAEKQIETCLKMHNLSSDFNELNDSKKFSTPINDRDLNNTTYYTIISENRKTNLSINDVSLDSSYKHNDDLDEIPCMLEKRPVSSNDHKSEKLDLMEKSAAIIQAGIRGYLTRRLLRTEKVEALKDTIKEAVLCALKLHSENNDSISNSDVELHRRLTNQVIYGCNAFHAVFFDTTLREKMSIISLDRHIKLERQKKVPKSLSNKSTPRSRVTSLSQVSSITV